MVDGEARSTQDIRVNGRWDGKTKYFINECVGCDWHEQLTDGEVCFVGNAWKLLSHEKVLQTCGVRARLGQEDVVEQESGNILVYTPEWGDFFDGTVEVLREMGFSPRIVQKNSSLNPGFSLE